MQKIKNIEFLRLLFMLSVVWMHLTAEIAKTTGLDCYKEFAGHFANGGKAVDGFFIISGFLFYLTFKHSTTVIDFIKKKILRLSPVILFTLIIGFIASLFGVIKFSFHSAILTLTFTNVLTDMSIGNWDGLGVTWFVGVLFWVLLFYFYLTKNFDKKYVNLIFGVITIVSYFLVLKTHHGSLGSPHKTFYGIFNVGFLRGFADIGVGYFIGQWYKDNYSSIQNNICSFKQKIAYTALELLFLGIVIVELFILNSQHKYNLAIVIDIIILTLLFLLKRGFISEFVNRDWCVNLAKYSYSIYIVHMFIFDVLYNFIIKFSGSWYLCPTLFLIPVVVGVLMYHFVEVPCARFLKKKWFA